MNTNIILKINLISAKMRSGGGSFSGSSFGAQSRSRKNGNEVCAAMIDEIVYCCEKNYKNE